VFKGLFEAIIRFAPDLLHARCSAMRKFGMVFGAPATCGRPERSALTAATNVSPKDINSVSGPPLRASSPVKLMGQIARYFDDGLLVGH